MRAGRQPDKPGTFRIRPDKTGGFRLSGVQSNGSRVRLHNLTETAAQTMAAQLFKSPDPFIPAPSWERTDDWGFPIKVSDETIASVADTLKIPDPAKIAVIAAPSVPVAPEITPEDKEKRERRAKNARSLMDLAGIAGAAGDVMIARKLCEAAGKEPVKPDQKQVNDLRDSIKEMLIDWFGDSEIEPWKMAILLALGIPISMLLQSPRRKVEPEAGKTGQAPDLKSVP